MNTLHRTVDLLRDEVRANILAQPLLAGAPGVATVADLSLPEPFLARVADRILHESFDNTFRTVFGAPASPPTPTPRDVASPLPEIWPELRGHRPTLSDTSSPTDHFPGPSDPPDLRHAAEHVARRLAGDGLVRTTIDAAAILAPLLRSSTPHHARDLLRRTGLPMDLAEMIRADDASLIDRLHAGDDHINALADHATFRFKPAWPGFVAIDDAGSQPVTRIRVQMSRPNHWTGEGGGPRSGDNLDLLLHLARALPDVQFDALIHAPQAEALRASLASAGVAPGRVRIVPADRPVSQWAQDNCKPGLIDDSRSAVLLPRFASRSEAGAKLDPGDTAALAHFGDTYTIHSPLHFQGGNVMLVRMADSRRLLLVGEAEIARNVTLGLTPDQAREALRLEMGADSIAILPAVGFHLDTELSVRVVGNDTIAFVPDQLAAARIIAQSALRAMESARAFPPSEIRILRTFLDMRNDEHFVVRLWHHLGQASGPDGNLPAPLIPLFTTSPADPASPNAQRFLSALDLLAAPHGRTLGNVPPSLDLINRTLADRATLHAQLRDLGFKVVPVPSLAGHWSASVINALHLPGRMLAPVRGGFLKPLDDAALRVLRAHLDPAGIELIPIPAAESERRGGALHCSVAAFPDPNTR